MTEKRARAEGENSNRNEAHERLLLDVLDEVTNVI